MGKSKVRVQGGKVVLKSRAQVVGDIHYQSLVIESGALFNGRSVQFRGDGQTAEKLKRNQSTKLKAEKALRAGSRESYLGKPISPAQLGKPNGWRPETVYRATTSGVVSMERASKILRLDVAITSKAVPPHSESFVSEKPTVLIGRGGAFPILPSFLDCHWQWPSGIEDRTPRGHCFDRNLLYLFAIGGMLGGR